MNFYNCLVHTNQTAHLRVTAYDTPLRSTKTSMISGEQKTVLATNDDTETLSRVACPSLVGTSCGCGHIYQDPSLVVTSCGCGHIYQDREEYERLMRVFLESMMPLLRLNIPVMIAFSTAPNPSPWYEQLTRREPEAVPLTMTTTQTTVRPRRSKRHGRSTRLAVENRHDEEARSDT